MVKPSVLVVGAETRTQAEIGRALKDVAMLTTAPGEDLGSVRDFLQTSPSAVIVAVGGRPPGGLFELIAELSAGGIRVIVVGSEKDPDLILQSMRAGAREFVVENDHDELRRAVRELAKPADDGSSRGSILTFFPTRGGVGSTSIATNVAGALQRRGEKVCLVDFDLHLGDVLSFLDLPGTYSITDVLANMSRLDRDLLDASVMRHPSGVRVLAQSGKVEEAEHVRPVDVPALFNFLRQHYDRIVVDGVRGFDEMSLAVLDASHKLVMVLTQDVPAVRNTRRCLDLFRRLGYADSKKIVVVLNRYQKESKITPDVIAETAGLPVAHTVSNDFAAAIESINRGLLLFDVAPRSKLTKDIEAFAPVLVGGSRDGARRSGFFRTLLGGKRNENGATGTS